MFDRLLRAYRDGGPYRPVAEHIHQGLLTDWFGGTFNKLYLQGFGLDLDTLALANIAWCATPQENEKQLWEPCFERHTGHCCTTSIPTWRCFVATTPTVTAGRSWRNAATR